MALRKWKIFLWYSRVGQKRLFCTYKLGHSHTVFSYNTEIPYFLLLILSKPCFQKQQQNYTLLIILIHTFKYVDDSTTENQNDEYCFHPLVF